MTLRVPGANGTASHRGRNASTPTSAFALHENEQPPPFPARSTNSPSCLLLLPPPPPSALSPLIALASTTPISVPSTGCRCTALFRPISLSLSPLRPVQNPSPLRSRSRSFYIARQICHTLSLPPRAPLRTINSIRNFRRNITFSPKPIRLASIDSERKIYNLFPRI